ncbi:MAG: calcium-binding protein [bacterium]
MQYNLWLINGNPLAPIILLLLNKKIDVTLRSARPEEVTNWISMEGVYHFSGRCRDAGLVLFKFNLWGNKMSEFCYLGSAAAVCDLNIGPYIINLDCVPEGCPTKPNDILLGQFVFGKWDGTPDDFWIATSHGTSGDDIIDGNGLLAGIEAWSSGSVAQTANATYLGDKVYFQICGGDGNDNITGGNNWDVLYGGNDNDLLNGLGGSDQVNGDAGNDTAYGGDGNDWVDGGDGDDNVNGDAGCDNVSGGTGSDSVYGGDGSDNMFGDTNGMSEIDVYTLTESNYFAPETAWDGSDSMDGGAGNDMMFGQGGNDTMLGGVGDDGMDGGSGNDCMLGGDGNENMTGGSGDDKMKGEDGNDLMNGGSGNDYLFGGAGRDWIAGGTGDDEMTGGAGKDVFVFCDDCGCGGDDYISDFTTTRQRDQIDLTQLFNLDLVISSETGDPKSAFLELISFGADCRAGGGDDYSLGTIYIDSKQNIGRVFDLDSTFGTSSASLVRVAHGVIIDLPSDSFVYDGDWAV